MILQYGDLNFEVETVTELSHRAVYDDTGLDYLYTHVTIGVQAVWHAQATRSNAVTGQAVLNGRGNEPGVSIRDLRQYMLTPRRSLRITEGRDVMLQSPARRPDGARLFVCDAKGGPQPLTFDVLKIHGAGRTMICNFRVETYVNDLNNASTTHALLSNRWRLTEDIDELNYVTRYVAGTAIFRKDYLVDHPTLPARMQPDDFRRRLFHPIPDNFKRENVNVVQEPDGVTLRYSFKDVEQPLNLGRGNQVLKLSGHYNEGVATGKGSFDFMVVRNCYRSLTIECKGRRTSSRVALINACARAAAAFGLPALLWATSRPLLPEFFYSHEASINIFGREARLTIGRHISGASFVRGSPLLNFPDEIANVSAPGGVRDNPRPIFSEGSRGTAIVRLVSQVLSDPGTNPEEPPAIQTAIDSTLFGSGGY